MVCSVARTLLPVRALSVSALCAVGMSKEAAEELAASIKAFLSTERGGQTLSPLVVELLVKHYIESVKVSDVKEVVLEDVLESADEAW